MISRAIPGALVVCGMLAFAGSASSQPSAASGATEASAWVDVKLQRKWKAAGRTLDYVVEAREIGVGGDAQAAPTGSIFSISYLRSNVDNPRARPVIFFFNGGPGVASALLHLSGLGPKRVPEMPRGEWSANGVEDSPHSLLDVADLVFVDAMGTGFSRLLPGGKPEAYYGIDADARSLAEFMRRWLDLHRRWTSPKYIMGESYGSFRAPLVADALTGGMELGQWRGIQLDGLILVGTVLDMTQLHGNPGNDLPYVLRLPTMAAIAWHYQKAADRQGNLAAFVQRARDFANDTYLPALNRGDALTQEQRAAVAKQVGEFIGLAPQFVLERNLRVSAEDFTRALLADRGLIVGSYDARDTLPATAVKGMSSIADPSSAGVAAQLSAVLNDYLRRDLGIATERPYDEVNYRVGMQWSWDGKVAGPYWNSAPALTDLMAQNPAMRVLVISGYYDLTTPFAGAERSLSRVGLPANRVHFRYTQSGHAPYAGDESLRRVADEIRSFLLERVK